MMVEEWGHTRLISVNNVVGRWGGSTFVFHDNFPKLPCIRPTGGEFLLEMGEFSIPDRVASLMMDKLRQVMGEPEAVKILGPKSFHGGMFIDNQAECILKIRPGVSYGRDEINFVPVHCCNVLITFQFKSPGTGQMQRKCAWSSVDYRCLHAKKPQTFTITEVNDNWEVLEISVFGWTLPEIINMRSEGDTNTMLLITFHKGCNHW